MIQLLIMGDKRTYKRTNERTNERKLKSLNMAGPLWVRQREENQHGNFSLPILICSPFIIRVFMFAFAEMAVGCTGPVANSQEEAKWADGHCFLAKIKASTC